MRFGDSPPQRTLTYRSFVAVSLALHAALGWALYQFGGYQVDPRQQEAQVAASLQATTRARTVRRVEDLQKIKEVLEQVANRESGQEPQPSEPLLPLSSDDPHKLLEQARTLSKAIDEIDRDLKAEELAELTGKTKEQARAEIDADARANATANVKATAQPPGADPVDEIARIEQQARVVLAKRSEAMQRKTNGVQVVAGAVGEGIGADVGYAGRSDVVLAQRMAALVRGGEMAAPLPGQADGGAIVKTFTPGPEPTARTVKGSGRMLGADAPFADRIYLNTWYVIGPFPGRGGQGVINTPKYPPEDAVLLDAVYYGKDRRLIKWEYVKETSYPFVPRDHAEFSVYYGYTEVLMDRERDLLLWVGADDDAKVWVNDQMVWKGGWEGNVVGKNPFFRYAYGSRSATTEYNRTEGRVAVRFQKGRNRMLFKLSNGPQAGFISLVLTPTVEQIRR